jgi:hypothetical protein
MTDFQESTNRLRSALEFDGPVAGGSMAVAVATVAAASNTAPPVALNPDHVTRQEAARQACENIGITWPETILPPGTALYESGVVALKADRHKWARLPFAAEALPAIQKALASEDRRDVEIPVASLRLDPTTARVIYDRLNETEEKPGLGYDKHAFSQICARVPELSSANAPRGHASNLLYLDADLRAEHVNRAIRALAGEVASEQARSKDYKQPMTLVRTKMSSNGKRIARAFLSERFADVSDLHVGEALQGALNGNASTARLDYRPGDTRSQFEVIYPSEIPVPIFRVGDVHKAVILISNSETGQGSISVQAGVVRARCANLTLSHGFGVEVNFRHLGNADRVKAQLKAAIGQAAAQISPLIDTIIASTSVMLPEGKSPGDVFAMLAKRFDVEKPVATAWREVYEGKYAEFGANLWSVTSAITDAAQRTSSNWWEQQEQEKIAAQTLSQQWRVFTPPARVGA